MRKVTDDQNGAIIMEASIALPTFMFLIVMIMCITNLCIAQAKIGIALNNTAEEMSQFLYPYSVLGFNAIQAEAYEQNTNTREQVVGIEKNVVEGVLSLQQFGQGVLNGEVSGESVENTWNQLSTNYNNASDIITEIIEIEDKSAWLKSLLVVAGNEAYEASKGVIFGAIATGLMKKHLEAEGISTDKYLKQLGVVNGYKGLNLLSSGFYINGTEDIHLVCKYDLKVVNLINHDISFHIVQSAKTKAWGAKSIITQNVEMKAEYAQDGSETVIVNEEGEGGLFGVYAAKAQAVQGYTDVIIHTSQDGNLVYFINGKWKEYTVEDLQKNLEIRGKAGKNIRLVSCGTGGEVSDAAYEIANKLNVNVLAANDTVWAYPDGTLEVGPAAGDNSGGWEVIQPGDTKKKETDAKE